MTKLVPDKSLSFCLAENHENFINSWLRRSYHWGTFSKTESDLVLTANLNKNQYYYNNVMAWDILAAWDLWCSSQMLARIRPGATRWQVGWVEIFHFTTGLNLIQKHNPTIFGKRKLKILPTLGHSRPDGYHYNYLQNWNGFRGNRIFNIKSINGLWPSVFTEPKIQR